MPLEHRPTKEPWMAASLSFIYPGIGHFYAGAWRLGLLMVLASFVLGAAILWAAFCPYGNLLALIPLASVILGFEVVNVWTAHRAARKRNSPEAEAARRQVKDPFLAIFLTQIVPGVGHLYLGRIVGGILLVVATLVIWSALPIMSRVAELLIAPVFTGAICWAAWSAGPASRKERRRAAVALCVLVAFVGLTAVGFAFMLRRYVVEAFVVPHRSMAPTIQPGDKILVLKTRSYVPRRGDVVVFPNPRSPEQTYVKRVVGLAGEEVEFRRDGLYINGVKLTEGPCGRIKYTSVDGQRFAGEGDPLRVPAGCVFLAGDNSPNSMDSRFWGPVLVSEIKGRAYKRYWPLSRQGKID